MEQRSGAEGKEQGTLNSPTSEPAPLHPCTSAGFERCGEKSGSKRAFPDSSNYSASKVLPNAHDGVKRLNG
ncbi:hypothetical protein N0Y54_40540 [Nostoc punctiforme UO1]|uniref:hypothetical protein n=1 Tax=Nostoc punctiforme TaxID=272131 RepID=UPI0030AAC472